MLSILKNVLLSFNVIVALLIILIVLMQRPKNEGLGSAFGGGMTENLFGAQTTNVLATITRWLGGLFFAISLILTYIYAHETGVESSVAQRLRNAAVPVAPATPAPATPAPGATPAPSAASAPVAVPGAAPSSAPAELPKVLTDPAQPVAAPKPVTSEPAAAPATAAPAPAPAAPAPVIPGQQ